MIVHDDQLSGLRVLAHPLRLRMLSLLTGSVFSAMELSRELGVSQALASYHLRQLHAAGVIELAEVRSHRGGQERRFMYRPHLSGTSDTEGFTLFAAALAVELRRRSQEAADGGDRVSADAELWVEPADWAAAVQSVRTASVRLHEQARPPRTDGTVRVSVSALLFPMAQS